VALLVERIHDRALVQGQSFLLDGTLSNYAVAEKNIERSLKRGRLVQILYVYQEPAFAWQFVRARQLHEGRHIPPEKFVDQYFMAREVVQKLKDCSGLIFTDSPIGGNHHGNGKHDKATETASL
jgi:hypothetical protein